MSASLKPARISHCEQKLACLQFDFGVVNTVGDDFAQEVPSVALRLQRLTADVI